MKILVRVEPNVTKISDVPLAWTGPFPDANKYNLKYTRRTTDYRFRTPLSGYNTEIWLIEGLDMDIDKFVSENPTAIKLTPAEANTLGKTIDPARKITTPEGVSVDYAGYTDALLISGLSL